MTMLAADPADRKPDLVRLSLVSPLWSGPKGALSRSSNFVNLRKASDKCIHLAEHVRFIRQVYVVMRIGYSNHASGWHAGFEGHGLCSRDGFVALIGRS